jgi:hypothetical protein
MRALGRPEDGLAKIESSLDLLDRRYSPSDPIRGSTLLLQGQLLIDAERYDEALMPLEAAVEILKTTRALPELETAGSALTVARERATAAKR